MVAAVGWRWGIEGKEYMLLVVISSGDARYSIVIIVNNTVLYT